MTYFLRFTDETAFNTACNDAGLWIDDNNPRPALLSHTHTMDVLGPLVQVSFTGNSINWSEEDEGIIFNVALNDDKTGWVYKATATEHSELLLASYNVNFSDQINGNSDSAVLEATMENGTLSVDRLIFDEDDPANVIGREPATNTSENLGPTFDAWHVNAKFTTGLPDGWDTYLVSPNPPVRIFAGDQQQQ
jgi:hypothetical protein